jgi:hypothetical protein
MEVSLASLPYLQHIYLKPLVKLIVNYLTVNKKNKYNKHKKSLKTDKVKLTVWLWGCTVVVWYTLPTQRSDLRWPYIWAETCCWNYNLI